MFVNKCTQKVKSTCSGFMFMFRVTYRDLNSYFEYPYSTGTHAIARIGCGKIRVHVQLFPYFNLNIPYNFPHPPKGPVSELAGICP